jgi:amino-acid N-acetyltransferase
MNAQPRDLPAECQIRPARDRDMWAIRLLVLSALLDPTQLHWQNFIAIECEGKIVACGQLRRFSGSQELGSMVVARSWRDRGLGSALVKALIRQSSEPLYLECMGWLVEFYRKFGFVEVPWESLPKPLKTKFAVGQLGSKVLPLGVTIMQYRPLP